MTLTATRLVAVIEAAGYEPQPHSGRAMEGRACVATTAGDDDLSHADVVDDIALEAADGDECAAITHGVRIKGVGRDAVFYWPDVPWAAGDDPPAAPVPVPVSVSPDAVAALADLYQAAWLWGRTPAGRADTPEAKKLRDAVARVDAAGVDLLILF